MWPFSKPAASHSCTKKHVFIFLAGASALCTLKHLYAAYAGVFPVRAFGMELTYAHNTIAILVGAVVTAGLLWLASRETHR